MSDGVEVNGRIAGMLQWIQYAHPKSYFDAQGNKVEKALTKTANDFKGNRVGDAGRIRVVPRQFQSPYNLDLMPYCLQYFLKDKSGNIIGESISEPSNKSKMVENPKIIDAWGSIKDIPVNDVNDAVTLQVNLIAEPQGIKKPMNIFTMELNLKPLHDSVERGP